jgi:hypothetical protein
MRPSGAPNQWSGSAIMENYSGLDHAGVSSLGVQGCAIAEFCKSQAQTRSK